MSTTAESQAASVLSQALASHARAGGDDDPTRERILDAAVLEAGAVGLTRLTVDEVARRAGVGRMTLYRRFAKREQLIEALLVRETARFLGAVAGGLETEDPAEGVAGSFVAAMRFVREHPMLKRLSHADPGGVMDTVAAGEATILRMGTEFIATQLRAGGLAAREARWAADVSARLFLTYVALPPTDPDPHDDAQLTAFARGMLVPLYTAAATANA